MLPGFPIEALGPIAIEFSAFASSLFSFSVSVEFIETYLVFAPAVTFLSWATLTASVSFVPAATFVICLVIPLSSLPTETDPAVAFQVATNLLASVSFAFKSSLLLLSSVAFVCKSFLIAVAWASKGVIFPSNSAILASSLFVLAFSILNWAFNGFNWASIGSNSLYLFT